MQRFALTHPAKSTALQSIMARLLCSAALSLFLPVTANANPQNGQVVAGSASIAQSGSNTLNINQQSQKAIINWQSFSIATGQTTNFIQPDASAITLNRVTGVDPSSIMGNLNANGQIWLINPNGIAFSKSARVDVAGLLATTIDIANQDFLGGTYRFTSLANPGAMVTNAGRITVRNAGLAALVAPGVENSGVIQANLGQIQLSSAAAFTIDFYGDGLFNFTLDKQVTQAIKNANGTQPTAAVTNTGRLIANGGTIALTANVASSVVSNSINMSGYAQATSAKLSNGQIILDGGDDGTVEVAGSLNASGTKSGQTGGSVEVTGNNVDVAATAKINASGSARGGSIRVASQNSTSIAGVITAKNTNGTRSGGAIETSGHDLFIGGSVDAGQGGSWLLDPYDLTIGSAAASTINSSLGAGTNVTLQTTASGTIGPGSADASGNGDIIIGSAINWGTAATLTLDAYRSIDILAPITVSGAGGIVLKTNDGGSDGVYSFGLGPSGFLGSLSFTGTPNIGQSLTINGASYTLLYSTTDVENIDNNLSGHYALATSLNAASIPNWTPIGYSSSSTTNSSVPGYGAMVGVNATPAQFIGAFDGLGHTISNLVINNTNAFDLGLFSSIGSAGTVQNLGLVGGSLTSGGNNQNFGLLAGWDLGTINNVYATGSVNAGDGTQNIGDLIGWNWGGTIFDSYATGNVIAGNNSGNVGGLVGSMGFYLNGGGTIANSYATGNVSGGSDTGSIGGLIGDNNSAVIRDSYATGNVSAGSGSAALGGLAGSTNGYWGGELVTASYATGTVSGSNDSMWVGGLIGDAEWNSTTTNSYATGNVTGGSDVGGLIGWNGYTLSQSIGSAINTSYATGTVSGSSNVGGLVGFNNSGAITASHATGDVSGMGVLGGLIGENYGGSITQSYVTGNVTGSGMLGGFIGYASYGTIGNSYSTGAVTSTGTGDYVGGFAGYEPEGDISNSYATGTVIGGDNSSVGGFIGLEGYGNVENSYATGNVIGGNGANAGGFIGWLGGGYLNVDGIARNSFSTGNVTAGDNSNVGGFVGLIQWFCLGVCYGGSIFNAYSTGNVEGGGSSNVGGFVGFSPGGIIQEAYSTGSVMGGLQSLIGGFDGSNYDPVERVTANISSVYWDATTSGISIGIGGSNYTSGPIGLTTTQLKSQLPLGFDPSVWAISSSTNHGYPYLLALGGQLTVIPLTWSVADTSTTYGTLATLGGVAFSGLLPSDNGLVLGTIELFQNANETDPVTLSSTLAAGTYYEAVVGLTGNAANNYSLSATGNVLGTLTIDPALLTITASSFNRYFGQANPPLTYTITMGTLFEGDTLTGSLATIASASSAQGTYPITQGNLSASSNYILTFVPGTLTVALSPDQQNAVTQSNRILTKCPAACESRVPGMAAIQKTISNATIKIRSDLQEIAILWTAAHFGGLKAVEIAEFTLDLKNMANITKKIENGTATATDVDNAMVTLAELVAWGPTKLGAPIISQLGDILVQLGVILGALATGASEQAEIAIGHAIGSIF